MTDIVPDLAAQPPRAAQDRWWRSRGRRRRRQPRQSLSVAWVRPGGRHRAATSPTINRIFSLAGTDGWVYLRGDELTDGSQVVFPDPLGEDRNMYAYGFRDASRWQRILQTVEPNFGRRPGGPRRDLRWKGQTQNASPLLWVDEGDNVQIVLYNLGWQVRPDIPDGHTIHWHGFRNAIPWFDGVPEMAAGAPIGKTLTYFYNPVDPGTYMYHCHWEDVEHIQMGMTGIVFVNPKQNTTGIPAGHPTVPFYTHRPGERFVFNDDNGASAYDRQFAFMLMDFNVRQHWQLAHIQQPDWSDYDPSAWAMNGRSYPDTLLPERHRRRRARGRTSRRDRSPPPSGALSGRSRAPASWRTP